MSLPFDLKMYQAAGKLNYMYVINRQNFLVSVFGCELDSNDHIFSAS